MRARIDISELETQTKIRAKYLRALENEEWNLLPGPTYVKSFLKTYADALGLDGRLFVEEYKLRHEHLSDVELQPIAPRAQRADRGARGRRGGGDRGRGLVVAALVVALLGALYLLGSGGGGGTLPTSGTGTTPRARTTPSSSRRHRARHHAAPSLARLTLVATGRVYVCLQAGNRVLVPAQTLAAGDRRGPFRSRRFTMTFGNGSVRMVVNGHTRTVPATAAGIGYAVTSRGRTVLHGRLPTCGA